MKYILTLLLTVAISSSFAQDKIILKTDEEKYAYYASTFLLIEDHEDDRLPIEEELMLQAAKDAISGNASKVANEDMKAVTHRLWKKWDQQKKWDRRKTKPKDANKWTDEEKLAYHAVYSHITALRKKKWFNKDIVLQSAKDAFGGKSNRLKSDQFGWIKHRLDVKEAIARRFKGSFYAKRNWKAGIAYQKANKEKKGIKVTASGLQYRVIKEGTGKKPTLEHTVSITYKTTLIDGKVLESRARPRETRLIDLIQGLAEGLLLMKVGAKYELVVPPELGWAMSPARGRIPQACSTVIIEDATEYLDSLYLVRDLGVERIEPGHGNAIDDAGAAINEYIDHRLARERQIVASVADGAGTVGDIVDVVYAGVPAGLRHAAIHQVGVQLAKLSRDGAVTFVVGMAEEETEVRLQDSS